MPPRARLALEVLEDRTVPSVSVTGGGGNLNITDNDTSGHTINVDQTATQGTFTVQVDTGPVMTFTGINNINANLGADSDALALFNPYPFATTNLSGNLTVTAADGNNDVNEEFFAIKGKVSVSEGNGSDDVGVSGIAIYGNLSVTLGNGPDTVGTGASASAATCPRPRATATATRCPWGLTTPPTATCP